MDNKRISVSTEPVKELDKLIEYIEKVKGVADYIHFDIMDGEFVEQKTYSSKDVKVVKSCTNIPLDVHLMVKEPYKQIKRYIDAGANILTIHYEAFEDKSKLEKALKLIKDSKALVGISICPDTSVDMISSYLPMVDLVLVMSVIPGKSGQKYLTSTNKKIKQLYEIRKKENYNFFIQLDGGINVEVVQKLTKKHYDILVSGSYIYNSDDKELAVKLIK